MIKNLVILAGLILAGCHSQPPLHVDTEIVTGAGQTGKYLELLNGKRVGLVANHTSVVGNTHLADTLISLKVNLVKIFAPEHGFRGTAGAGDKINDSVDARTGIPVISLYGSSFKPAPSDLKDIDIMVYDIQDVGVRFYTYISTMHYVMEACAGEDIPVIILDRPNPLGHYIDGPVLEPAFKSFVGMHPVPVVYGMTSGELARMINEEGWLLDSMKCRLKIITCKNYDHGTHYELPVNPSPNLNSMEAVYLYPSLCFFEGTIMSLGRGTDYPFRVIGHPDYPDKMFSFMPATNSANKNPLFRNTVCFGIDLRTLTKDSLQKLNAIELPWLTEVYRRMDKGDAFFIDYFEKLSGTADLRKQILDGKSEKDIRESWQKGLSDFKKIRRKYLLYKDFE